MKLYENIVIGNFLYALGFSVRSKMTKQVQPAMVNLLQQTPADTSLADVLVEFPGTTRLIEFKQKNNKSNKERDKHKLIQRLLEAHSQLEPISRSIHWYIETLPVGDDFDSIVTPYIDAFPQPKSIFNFWDFVNVTANEAVQDEYAFSENEIKEYLHFIRDANGSDYIGTGGLLVHIDNQGNVVYCELADMIQMRLSHEQYIDDMQKLSLKSYEKTLTQDKTHEKSLHRGITR